MSKRDQAELTIANEIRDHAEDTLNYIADDYKKQIDKWEVQFRTIGAAFNEAVRNHKKPFEEIARERQARAELIMLAFSMVGGIALSWASLMIQNKLKSVLIKPEFKSKAEYVKLGIITNSGKLREDVVKITGQTKADKPVLNKIIGDLQGKITGIGVDKLKTATLEKLVGEKNYSPSQGLEARVENAIDGMKNAQNTDDFTTNLLNTLILKKTMVISDIKSLAIQVGRDEDFGFKWLEFAKNEVSGFSRLSLREKQAECIKLVDETLLSVRNKWADEWFYYGHDPVFLEKGTMSKIIEREIWALWLIDQDLHMKTSYVKTRRFPDEKYIPPAKVYSVNKRVHKHILTRLAQLDIVLATNFNDASQQAKRLIETRRGVAVDEINGDIDTATEVSAMNKWAKNHKPQMLSGNANGTQTSATRKLNSLENMMRQ